MHLTGTGVIVGTPTYMAPEQAKGEAVDARCDLFSLGCVLYRMTTGVLPFPGKDVMSVLLALATTQPKPPRELSPAVPAPLSDLILRLLAKDPAGRPASAGEVAEALAAIEHRVPRVAHGLPAPARASRRWRFGLVSLCVALLLGTATYLVCSAVLRLARDRGGTVPSAGEHDAERPAGTPAEPVLPEEPVVEAVLGDGRLRHWREVDSIVFSPDGKLLATGGTDGTARVWDPATGEERARLVPEGLFIDPLAVALHPTRKLLAMASRDGQARLWDLETRTVVRSVLLGGWVNSVAFSPDGRLLAALAGKTGLKVVEVDTGNEVFTLAGGNPQGTDLADRENTTGGVAFRPNGNVLACRTDKGVMLLDPDTGQQKDLFKDAKAVSCLAWSPDGRRLATGTMHPDPEVKVLDAATGKVLHRFDNGLTYENVLDLAFSPDGGRLAASVGLRSPSAGWTAGVWLWDLAAGPEGQPLRVPLPYRGFFAVAFTPDGRSLVTGSGSGRLRLWDAATGRERAWPWQPMTYFSAMALSPNGGTVACGDQDGDIRLFDAATFQQRSMLRGHTAAVSSLGFAPDSRTLASSAIDETVRLWDTEQQQETLRREHEAWGVAFRPDGRVWVSGALGGPESFKVWDAVTGTEGPRLDLAGVRFAGCWDLSPDNATLAAGCTNPPAIFYDLANGKKKGQLASVPGAGGAAVLGFSPDGKTLALACWPAAGKWPPPPLTLWDVATGELRLRMEELAMVTYTLAFRPDGKVLASGGGWDGSVCLWDTATGKHLRRYRVGPPGGVIHDVAFTPDGRRLLTRNGNGTVSILRLTPP